MESVASRTFPELEGKEINDVMSIDALSNLFYEIDIVCSSTVDLRDSNFKTDSKNDTNSFSIECIFKNLLLYNVRKEIMLQVFQFVTRNYFQMLLIN